MLRVQYAMGGGVLNPVIEHVGDITHRMSHLAGRGVVMGYEKVVKTLRWLSHRYGFEREFRENIINNANYRGVKPAELAADVRSKLGQYAAAHAKLPVYNEAQWLARQAAIALGHEQFGEARQCLEHLIALCPNEEQFAIKALEYRRNPDGTLRRYRPSAD
jgi:hypothetical protein